MPDKFTTMCTSCGQEYEVVLDLQGQTFKCVQCGENYTIPSFSQFKVQRDSTGVYSPPEAHINAIKQLLQGYGKTFAILKEFVQNAEDANSKSLHIEYVNGVPDACHPLLQGPSLLIVDDGKFDAKDQQAIPSLHLGTKSIDERAIGKFGIGLKCGLPRF